MFDNAWVDSLSPWRRSDMGRELKVMELSAELWGDPDHLTRQLLAASPEIPPGLDHQGLCTLLGIARIGIIFGDRIPTRGTPAGTQIIIGFRRFTIHEARYEIVRRAIKSRAY